MNEVSESVNKPKKKKNIETKDSAANNQFNTETKKNTEIKFQQNKNEFIEISVVIPLFNEEESLPELSFLLEEELTRFVKNRWEVIFIDDGSTDQSFNVLKDINKRNHRFKAIRFRRNYGKSAALDIGFGAAKGKYVITMDSDLQDDPAEIPGMIKKLNEGYDLVSGWKKKRYDPITKTLPSKLFNYITSLASGIKLHDFNCGLKAYRKEVIKTVNVYGEMHRYIPALAYWEGFKVTEMVVKHHPRRYGVSKFGVSRFVNGFLDLLTVLLTTKYFKRPLHFFGLIGSLLTLIGLSLNVYLTIEWFLGLTYLSNRPLALFGVALIIVGVQFISTGLLGEMLTKNQILQNKNIYSIKDRL